ncbi:MAG: dihydrodipicolinate synthase family protein [Candidatus Binataceae bacterium]
MQSLDDYIPRPGLSTPIVTVFDREGRVLEDEQRSVVRFVVQDGRGADIVFAAGTTGEWDRIDNPRRQDVIRIAVDECRRISGRIGRKIEAWAGITAHTRAETIANLEYAIDLEADAAVIAPLSIRDSGSPSDFVQRELGGVFQRRGEMIPIFLYDNADIAAPGKSPHLHTRDVKQMARLPFVRGIKVTAGKAVLGNYTRAASHFKLSHEFAVYAGIPYLIFDLFAPADGISGTIKHRWNRYLTQRAMPYGVVSGASNVMPREWQRAWRVCRAGNPELMRRYEQATDLLRSACEFERSGKPYSPVIACYKTALREMGVIESDAAAQGSPALEAGERRELATRIRAMRRHAAGLLEPGWISEAGSRPHLREVPRAVRPHA